MPWDYRRYGSPSDPIHKSHLNDITGDYGCPTRFRYQMDARVAAGGIAYDVTRPVRGDAACGTAAHETIARVLSSELVRPRVLAGPGAVSRAQVERAFLEEFDRETASRRVEWYDRDRQSALDDCITMITSLLDDMHWYVAEVVLVEPAFIVRLGNHWLSGHVDLLYRPRGNPQALAMADWKTGQKRPNPIVIDHSWEAGVYSVASRDGWFLRREQLEVLDGLNTTGLWTVRCDAHAVCHPSRYIAERECAELALSTLANMLEAGAESLTDMRAATGLERFERLEQFPTEIYHVHLHDYVPYKRAGKKDIRRAEDLAYYQRHTPGSVSFKVGERRGPAWLPVRITEHDVPRVAYRIKNVVGMIRMGRFIDQVGDRCTKCPYADDCLNGGYAMRSDDRRALERSIDAADVSAADELAIDD